MKANLKLILVLPVLAAWCSCEPPVTFNDPQPVHTANLENFPKRFRGVYLNPSDHSTLLIEEKRVCRSYEGDIKVHPNQLGEDVRQEGDMLINTQTNERMAVRREGDSLVYHLAYVDTLFEISENNIVRKFKGYYFLNTKYHGEGWEVKKMELASGQLKIGSIRNKEEIAGLLEIAESVRDTIPPYQITATKKQFKEFVKKNGFSENEVFVRQGRL